MKQLLQFKTFLLLAIFSLLTGTQVWAQDSPFYTLDATGSLKGTNNSYAGNCDIESGGITWNVTGNTTLNPWRIGGKSISNVDRTVYTKTPMTKAVSKVALTVGAASSITVNSLKLTVASDADFTNVLDEVTATFAANSTINFTPSTGSAWESGAYYKFTFNVTVSGSSNKFVQFSKVEIYEGTADPSDTRVATTTTFPQSAYSVELGEDFTAPTATVKDADGSPVAGAVVTYSSDNEDVATVNTTTGAVTIVGAGTANITATYEGDDTAYKGSTGKYSLTVSTIQNISDITANGTYTVRGTIVAKSQRGFIVGDGTGYVYYYNSSYNQASYNVGDKVQISGDVTTYGGVFEFSSAATLPQQAHPTM
ncbi:MAG: Ig-like domain-containing protein [Alloprevotella sp.]|nr:Ig-like domain-containing protein [Alloprevotella sp.]